ncbi:hypothetical protein BT67DRAFT_123270 [Trichocladium antarcticum]|uniref:Inositol-pentakisphosphate 2-kinase n=1 Tax=Trichocladium antarcticum TaxID=1450529 RepID=A0AAN6URG2_9PEZI|nr:hypothetical protein BT67DRAFT_123270 [Trichocladium antarcticum]
MSASSPLPIIPELPPSAADDYEFKFVGEGASNVVFEVIVQPHDESSRNLFQWNLLRVPKAGTKAHTYGELIQYWETVVKPLFEPEDLVQHQLVGLGGDAVVARLNEVLEKEDDTRRVDFRGSRVAKAGYGLLVEDMRQRHPDDLTLEFKPKWLAQSPNAPASAIRCRTCAREAFKHHTKPPAPANPTILCALDYLTCSSSPPILATILHHLAPSGRRPAPETPQQQTEQTQQHGQLSRWLQTNTVLPRLRAAQLANDRTGPLGADAHDAQFQLAMTLRDCTCFVRIPADPSAPVEAKLADLDKKNWAAKLGYWQATERRLIEGGYYAGTEVPRQETDCQLERVAKGAGEGGKGEV